MGKLRSGAPAKPRAALGQQANGRGSNDAGRPGHDGNPAIEANSIGHV